MLSNCCPQTIILKIDSGMRLVMKMKTKLDDKAWRPWGIPTQECVKCSLKYNFCN